MNNNMRNFSNSYNNFLFEGPLRGINLTSIRDPEEFYFKQILDSILPFEKSKIIAELISKEEYAVVDIGFGGGFPIIPLAFKYSTLKFYGIESKNKKVVAVNQIVGHFKLQNVKLFYQRFENIHFNKKLIVISKGVGKIEEILSNISADKEVYLFFYKGPNLDELENVENILNRWEIIEDFSLEIEGTKGRRFIGFKKKDVPRGTSKKNLVKFSELI